MPHLRPISQLETEIVPVTCVGCGQTSATPLLHFPEVPVSGIYLDDPGQTIPRFDVSLSYCGTCGLVTKSLTAGAGLDYATIDRGTAQQMPDYAGAIVQSLRDAGLAMDAAVLEVGSNDGSFLAYLAAKGFTRLSGIEPSRHLAGLAQAKGFPIEVGYCTAGTAQHLVGKLGGPADAVVCRHTLEHVPDPADLLEAIARLLRPGGLALIEVPDFDWVTETLAVHEVWDEHISYFSAANLTSALLRQGFEVLSCERVRFRDTRNLVALARRPADGSLQATVAAGASHAATLAGCASLPARWHALTQRLAAEAPSWPRPVLAIGASHIQSNFIHFAGLAGVVSALIDDDPRKAGKYVLLDAPRPVISTAEALATVRSGTVLRTAFPYPAWMDKVAAALGPHGVAIVDPYAGAS